MGIHELLSGLLYIGERHILYSTCGKQDNKHLSSVVNSVSISIVNETKPSTTLAERFKVSYWIQLILDPPSIKHQRLLQAALIGRDNPLPELDAAADLQTINSHLHDELAIQLNVRPM